MSLKRNYRGWLVYDNETNYRPKTGRFQALRFGVSMGSQSETALVGMIDQHEKDRAEWFHNRAALAAHERKP